MHQHDFTFDNLKKKPEEMIPPKETAMEIETPSSLGRRLLQARNALHISAEDIADNMRVSYTVIHAIERDDMPAFDNLVFFRGYVRAYAKLVHIPHQEIEAEFIRLGLKEPIIIEKIGTVGIPQMASKSKKNPLMTYFILAVLAALITSWLYIHHTANSIPSVSVEKNSIQENALNGPEIILTSPTEVSVPKAPSNVELPNKPNLVQKQ